jgi:RNA polymerase sigma factor (sigma-70 family)
MKEQIDQLYSEMYDDYVRMYKSRAGANDVEDLLQEAFYRALYYSDSYDGNLVSLDTWFGGIIENCLKDLYKEKRNGSSMHEKLTPESAVIEPRYDEGFTKTLSKEIGKKKGDHKSILYLYFMCGYELKEIFSVVDTSYTVINQTVSRFKEYLRNLYPEYREA